MELGFKERENVRERIKNIFNRVRFYKFVMEFSVKEKLVVMVTCGTNS